MSGQFFTSRSEIEVLSDFKETSCPKDLKSTGCVLSCCQSCSYCSYTRASAKERSRLRQLSEQNKTCQRCMLCKSLCFCPKFTQCPQCCHRTECRGQASKVLAYLARDGCESSGGLCSQGWLHPPFQTKAPVSKGSCGSKRLRKPNQKHVPKRSPGRSHAQVGSGKGSCQVVPGLLQPSLPSSQTEQKMEANLRSQSPQFVPQYRHFQNGNTGDHPVILERRGVGHVARFQRRIFPHPNCTKVKKVSQVLPVQSDLSVHSPTFRSGHSSSGVYQGGQRGKTHGSSEGYQDPPVPRRLVAESPFPGTLPTTYPDPLGPMSAVGLDNKSEQIRVSSQTGLQFRRLSVRPDHRSGSTHSRPVGDPSRETEVHERPSPVYGSSIHVLDRPPDGHRETGVCRSPSYEAHPVASEEKLACSGSPRKSDPGPSITPSSFGLVVRRNQCSERSTPAPPSAHRSTVYRRLKRRLGRTLHCKRSLVYSGKSPSHKFPRTKSSSLGDTPVRASVQGSDCSCRNGQHDGGLVHKQAGGYEVRLSVCPPVETSVLVPPQRHNSEGKTHSRSLECDSGQAVQTQPGDSNGVVPFPAGIRSLVFQVDPASGGFVCNPVQSQTSTLCLTGTRLGSLGSRCPESTMGSFGGVRLSPRVPAPPGNFKVEGSGLSQDDPHRSRMAKHALVLGPSEPVRSDSLQASPGTRSSDSTFQRDDSQESRKPQSSCLAPRSLTIQERGFSDDVAARIEAPQRSSTRAVYKSKWAIFVKWCQSYEVDFRAPSVNQIADFLLHLFKERNLQPSTIEGYRTAIADMVGNDRINISTNDNLTRLLDSFHRDRPKGRRGVPSWNLSLVLHQLTKAPFEPLRKASLKHLTFKTVFVLALGSDKRRSEIHAWLYRNIRHKRTGVRSPFTRLQAFSPRTSWLGMARLQLLPWSFPR